MNQKEIIEKLETSHREFSHFIMSLNDAQLTTAPEGKWKPIQHLDHICRSVGAVSQALMLPKIVIRLVVGISNRPSKSYDALVEKYKSKLNQGGKAKGRFVPGSANPASKNNLSDKMENSVRKLCRRLLSYSEDQLDYYILPHPLLGKLTMREMLYFTIYHAEHHRNLIQKDQVDVS
ncbi:MAG: DinB family protein [Chitinophagaceae bacterium]|nr:DinB family protein [Chitinophagaceae bacterium]